MTTTTTGALKEQNLEKQIQKHMGGCITGFFHIFDRHHHTLPGKRFYSAKRLPQSPPVAETEKSAPATSTESDNTLPLRAFDSKEGNVSSSSWKDIPRLSLDSRATIDAKGSLHPKQIRPDGAPTPSVIARLMGLDPFLPEPESKPELRRSASESRVSSKDLFHSRFNPPPPDPKKLPVKKPPNGEAKSFFDSGDFFPEQRQASTIYGEIEDRIRSAGGSIDPSSKELEALKQILESLQLKGLLRSKQPSHQNQTRHRNFVYDHSPAAFVKPPRSRASPPINPRIHETTPSVFPRRERNPTNKQISPAKPKALSVGTERRRNESPGSRRASPPVQSPKLNTRRTGTDPTVSNRFPRNKRPTPEIHRKRNVPNVVVLEDESSSSSWSPSTSASTDTERPNSDALKRSATDAGPSPVSVLDSSFYKDEPSTPLTKRNIDFKDELEEDIWSPPISPIRLEQFQPQTSDGSDFSYISDILRANHFLPEGSDVFQSLENQQHRKQSEALDRKLIFDTVDEILDRNRLLPPSLDKIWSEIERLREQCSGEDLLDSVCSALRKDMTGDLVSGWRDCEVEMSEVVLDIERMIFKDLVCDSIEDLRALATVVPKRKLVF